MYVYVCKGCQKKTIVKYFYLLKFTTYVTKSLETNFRKRFLYGNYPHKIFCESKALTPVKIDFSQTAVWWTSIRLQSRTFIQMRYYFLRKAIKHHHIDKFLTLTCLIPKSVFETKKYSFCMFLQVKTAVSPKNRVNSSFQAWTSPSSSKCGVLCGCFARFPPTFVLPCLRS